MDKQAIAQLLESHKLELREIAPEVLLVLTQKGGMTLIAAKITLYKSAIVFDMWPGKHHDTIVSIATQLRKTLGEDIAIINNPSPAPSLTEIK